MKAYSLDFREKVLRALEKDSSSLRVAARFGVSASFVRKLRLRLKRNGDVEPRDGGGREQIVVDEHAQAVRDIVREKPESTLNEVRRELKKRTGLAVSEPTMSRTMRRLGLTHKRKTTQAAERDRPEVEKKRQKFQALSFWWNPARLVFIDETGVNLAMTRRTGWAPVGERTIGKAPFQPGLTATLVAALTLNGIEAPFLFPGAMDHQALRIYVTEVLAPVLNPGDIVVWDNLAVHADLEVEDRIWAVGARLEFLPPYSPDLNPIEMAWSMVKNDLRNLATRAWDSLVDATAHAVARITPHNARSWFRPITPCAATAYYGPCRDQERTALVEYRSLTPAFSDQLSFAAELCRPAFV